MKRSAMLLGLLSALSAPAPAHALREVIVGNQPLRPGMFAPELLAAVNIQERVYLYVHDGNPFFFFKGGPGALNEAMRRFAAIPANKREIILLPIPAKPLIHDRKPIAYDWSLHVPMGHRRGGDSALSDNRATLTIYIPGPQPPTLADPQKARKWIADLDSDDFEMRERASKELADLGPPVAALLRKALMGRVSFEAHKRMERILTDVGGVICLDVLELPDGVPVVGMEALLDRCRKELSNKDPVIRGQAAMSLIDYGAPSEEVLPDLEKVLKTEKLASPLAGAAWAASRLGAAARPLLPSLQATAKTADKNVARACEQAIDTIEKAKSEPVPDAEAKKRATIRKDIREFIAGLKGRADK
jgi:hypothetical protein